MNSHVTFLAAGLLACCITFGGCKSEPTLATASENEITSAEKSQSKTAITAIKSASAPKRTASFTGSSQGATATAEDSSTTEPTVVIYGRVTTADGNPATSISVELHGKDDGQTAFYLFKSTKLADAVTNGEGAYEVRGPNAIGLHLQIKGDTPQMQIALDRQALYKGSEPKWGVTRLKQDVELLPSHSLTGQVVNENGQPMAGLPVHIKPKFENSEKRLFRTTESTSTAAGSFDFENIAAGKWMVATAHPEYAPVTTEINIPTTEPVTLRLGSRGGSVTGHVYHKDTGAAVSGIPVSLSAGILYALEDLENSETKTAADGSFKFDRVASGPKTLSLTAGSDLKLGLAAPLPQPLRLDEGQTTDVTLFVYPGHTISGKVFDKDTGDPLPGVAIRGANKSPESSRLSDANGNYKLENIFPMRSTQYSMLVDLAGYQPEDASAYGKYNAVAVQLPEDDTAIVKDIPMIKKLKVRGIVVTTDGVPIPHAIVALFNNRSYTRDPEKQQVKPDGTFELETLPFVTIVAEAEAAGYGPVFSPETEVSTKDVEGIKLVMDVGSTVQGRVLGPDGMPVPGATVQQNKDYGSFSTYIEAAVSGENGEYLVKDAAKNITIKGKKEGFADSEAQELTLTPGEVRTGVDINLQQGHVISGRVVDAQRNPVHGGAISAQGTDGHYGHDNPDENGKFEFKDLAAGVYQLHVSSTGHRGSKTVDGVKAGTTDLEIVLDSPEKSGDIVKFTGTVVDDLSGDPIEDFTISGYTSSQVKKLDETGKFELLNVRIKTSYELTISSTGYQKQKFTTDHSVNGEAIAQTFRIGKGGALTGRVVEQGTGNPIADVTVINWGTTQYYERSRTVPENHTTTDKDGRFVLAPAPVGENTVQLKPASPYSEAAKTAAVKSEQTTDMGDIEISHGGTITGLVLRGPGDDPAVGESVWISAWSQEMQISKSATTDADGRFEFTGLPPRDYGVRAGSIGKNVTVEAAGSTEVTLRLGGVTITGTVTQGGAPVRASVSANGPEGQGISGYAQNGEYKIENAMPGSYKFTVNPQSGNYSNNVEETVEVPDQAEFVKNFVLPDGRLEVTVIDAAGEPVANAVVTLTQKSSNTGFDQRWLTRTRGSERSDSSGKVSFTGLAPGIYSVNGRKEGVGTAMNPSVEVPDGQAAQVQLQLSGEGGTLVSVALSYATGQGVPEAWCYLHGEAGPFTHGAKRDASGMMTITNIPPGKYTTNVSYWSHSQSERQIEIKANETVSIEDVLYPAGALHWTLKKADGSPAAGATVTVTPLATDPPEETRTGQTADTGLFVQRGLAGGSYQVTAQLPGKPAVTETFNVAAGANEQKQTTVPGW